MEKKVIDTSNRMEDFEGCYETYIPIVYAVIRKLGLKKDVDEYVQVGRIALYEAWQKHNPTIGDFAPYAYSYVSGRMKHAIKQNDQWGRQNLVTEQEVLTEISQAEMLDEELFLLDDWINRSGITKKEKLWIIEGYIHGFSIGELMEKYGVSAKTVKSWRHRAIWKLKKAYSKP